MIRLISIKELDILKNDPVRPHLEKTSVGKQVYVLDDLSAVICVCYCTQVPTNEEELELYKSDTGSVLVAYTVWSNKSGAGRTIVNELLDLVKTKKQIKQLGELPGGVAIDLTLLYDNGEPWDLKDETQRRKTLEGDQGNSHT